VELSGVCRASAALVPAAPNLYHVRVDVMSQGKMWTALSRPNEDLQPVFRTVSLRSTASHLLAAGLHQEMSERRTMSDDDFRKNYSMLKDLGFWLVDCATIAPRLE